MSDLMVGYCIISGVLFFFFIGSISIVCDMLWNKEEIIIIRKSIKKPETDRTQFVSDDYEIDDDLMD
jgi:hypothetical protein